MNNPPPFVGIKLGIPAAAYHASDGVNHSTAKEMDLSPKHYLQKISAPPEEPSDAQIMGTLIHSAVLENDLSGFVVRPDTYPHTVKGVTTTKKWNGNATYCKEWREAQTKPDITTEENVGLRQIVCNARNNALANRILYAEKGNNEVSCWAMHSPTGLLIKGRADRVTTDNQERTTIVDLKTCGRGDAAWDKFKREIKKWKYHSQAAWYLDLFGASCFVFVVVEKEAPFAIACYDLGPKMLARGRALNAKRLESIRQCSESGKWPEYPEEIRQIEMSDAEFQRDEL